MPTRYSPNAIIPPQPRTSPATSVYTPADEAAYTAREIMHRNHVIAEIEADDARRAFMDGPAGRLLGRAQAERDFWTPVEQAFGIHDDDDPADAKMIALIEESAASEDTIRLAELDEIWDGAL